MRDPIETQKICFVATADRQGRPDVSPKGSIIYVVDKETLAFANLYCQKTRKNLETNPNIAVAVADLKALKGYQLR